MNDKRNAENLDALRRQNQRSGQQSLRIPYEDDEDNDVRRSLSPGRLHRKYNWTTTHFYPDLNELSEIDASKFTSPTYPSSRSNEPSVHPPIPSKTVDKKSAWKKEEVEKKSGDEDSEQYESSEDFNEWCESSEKRGDKGAKENLKQKFPNVLSGKKENIDKRGISPDAQISSDDSKTIKYFRTPADILKSKVDMPNGDRVSRGESKNGIRKSRNEDKHQFRNEDGVIYSYPTSSAKMMPGNIPSAKLSSAKTTSAYIPSAEMTSPKISSAKTPANDRTKRKGKTSEATKGNNKQGGECMVTNFDNPWPVSEFQTTRAHAQPSHVTSIGRVDSPVEEIFVYNRKSRAIDSFVVAKVVPQVKSSPENVETEKAWKSESYLFIKDPRSQRSEGTEAEAEGRKRFTIDYRKSSANRMRSENNGENFDSLTLKDFENCLEIPGESQDRSIERPRSAQLVEIQVVEQQRILTFQGTRPGRNTHDGKFLSKDDADLYWLFDKAFPRLRSARPNRSNSLPSCETDVDAIFSEDADQDTTRPDVISASLPSFMRKKADSSLLGKDAKMRQQYRWSTSIQEPETRVFLDFPDQWQNTASLNRQNVFPVGNLQKTRQPVTNRKIAVDNAVNERTFTITGQPKRSASVQQYTSDPNSTAYALVGRSSYSSGISEIGLDHSWDMERNPSMASKHKYLRERVVNDGFDDVIKRDDASLDYSKSPKQTIEYHSLQNLGQSQWSRDSEDSSNLEQISDDNTSSSVQSFPIQSSYVTSGRNYGSNDRMGSPFSGGKQRPSGRHDWNEIFMGWHREPPGDILMPSSNGRYQIVEEEDWSPNRSLAGKTPTGSSNNFRGSKRGPLTPRIVKARHENKAKKMVKAVARWPMV